MKKFFSILIIIIFVGLVASQIDLQKISTVYKTDYFQNSFVNGSYIYTVGDRGVEKLLPDGNGHLSLVDEIDLIGGVDLANKVGNTLFVTTFHTDGINGYTSYKTYRISIETDNFTILDSLETTDNYQMIVKMKPAGNYLLVNKYHTGYEGNIYVYDENSLEPICTYSSSFLFSSFFRIMNDKYLLTYELDNFQERNHVHVFDLSDIYNIEYLGDVYFSGDLEDIDYIRSHPNKIDDNTMVMASWDKYIFFDITDPLNWQRLGEINFPDGSATNEPTFYSPDRLVEASAYNRVTLYDISDFSNPIALSYLDYDRGTLVGPIIVYNEHYLYTPSGSTGVDEFKIENDDISHIGVYPEIPLLGYNRIKGDYLIEAGNYHGLFIFDISDLNNTQFVSNFIMDECITDFRTDIENGILVATSADNEGNKFFSIYDISNIYNPILINKESIDNYALVTLDYPKLALVFIELGQIEGFDVSDVYNPTLTYTYNYETISGIAYLYNDHLYFSQDENHIGVINNLFDQPNLVNTIYDANILLIRHTLGNFFYTQHNSSNIDTKVYSLDSPDNPEIILELPNVFANILYLKNNLLIASAPGTMNYYDLNNNFDFYNPIFSTNTPFQVNELKFYEKNGTNYMFMADPTYCDIYSYTLDSLDTNENNIILAKTELFDNYPNPFNPSTTISLSLAKSSKDTKIEIYNLKGQKVRLLDISDSKIGINQVVWNGKNDNGKKVASGVYLYQLKQNGKTMATKKMLLLK